MYQRASARKWIAIMIRQKKRPLVERVTEAAEAALADKDYVCPVDVVLGIGWLDPNTFRRWRQGQIESLEETLQTSPSRLKEAMDLFASWVARKGLLPSEAQYVARTPQRQVLRFTRSGDATDEEFYRIHWVAPHLPARKRERLAERAKEAPELVVILPLKHGWVCHRCGGSGDLLIMEKPGPCCLRCAGLDDLEFLPSGDALLTRRVRGRSARHAVVVRFSRTRKRYERRGLLVEPEALAQTQRELGRQAGK